MEVTETVMGEAAAAGEVAAVVAVAAEVQEAQGVQEVQEAPWEELEGWEAPDLLDLTATVPGTDPARVAATEMETATVAEEVAATAGAARADLVVLVVLWVEWEARDLRGPTATVCGTDPELVMEPAAAMVVGTAMEVAVVTADAARVGLEDPEVLEGQVVQSEVWVEWEARDPLDLTATVCGTGRELARGGRPDRAGGTGESRLTKGRTSRVEVPGSTLLSRKCSTLIQRTRCSQYPPRSQARVFRESSPRDSRMMTSCPHLEMPAREGVAAVTVEAAVTGAEAETVLLAMEVALVVGLKDQPDPPGLEEAMVGADEARVARAVLEDLAGAWEVWEGWEGWVAMVPMVTVLGTDPAAVTVTATVEEEEGAGADEERVDLEDPVDLEVLLEVLEVLEALEVWARTALTPTAPGMDPAAATATRSSRAGDRGNQSKPSQRRRPATDRPRWARACGPWSSGSSMGKHSEHCPHCVWLPRTVRQCTALYYIIVIYIIVSFK